MSTLETDLYAVEEFSAHGRLAMSVMRLRSFDSNVLLIQNDTCDTHEKCEKYIQNYTRKPLGVGVRN